MQAITTKFIAPTNTKGSRVKATAQAGSVTLGWEYSLSSADNHKAAALALVDKFSWYYGDWISGDLSDGSSVWVCFDKVNAATSEEEDGTSGQDRDSYSDDQDRDSYSA